jgi:exopolyphosphatase / guanosine-5'-triphosphate,3'-diphosphate pyrophosphatase
LSDPDFAKAVLALRLAVMFMHARLDVDLRQLRLRMKHRIELDIRQGWMTEHPTLSYWIEKEREWWDEIGIGFNLKTGAAS